MLIEPPFALITRPLPHAQAWVEAFADAQRLPVLQDSAWAIEDFRGDEDHADAHSMAQALQGDPLFTLKLFAHVAQLRAKRGRQDEQAPETVTSALVMTGVLPFLSAFGQQPVAEDRFSGDDTALSGFEAVLTRGRRAACFALGFAVHRSDHDAQVLYEAALLHDFAELLLWLHAPALAKQLAQRLAAEPGLRSAQAQQALLNTTLPEVQHALMQRWRLPELLVRVTDANQATQLQVRNVHLAVRLARHTAQSWDNPAVPDDVRDIAELLHMGEGPTLALLREIDG
jgi:hypothetical protein